MRKRITRERKASVSKPSRKVSKTLVETKRNVIIRGDNNVVVIAEKDRSSDDEQKVHNQKHSFIEKVRTIAKIAAEWFAVIKQFHEQFILVLASYQ